jgi:RecA/RadA recombinase
LIFDRIEKDIAAMCQEGAPIRLVIIDSINAIQGRRAMNADTIMTQQIGDLALTLQDGFKRILPVQRKYKIAVILTSHVRAEMDQAEQMRGNKVKMAAGFGVQHYGEYFMYVEQNRSKAGSETLLGEKLEDENNTDLMDKAEKHRSQDPRLHEEVVAGARSSVPASSPSTTRGASSTPTRRSSSSASTAT